MTDGTDGLYALATATDAAQSEYALARSSDGGTSQYAMASANDGAHSQYAIASAANMEDFHGRLSADFPQDGSCVQTLRDRFQPKARRLFDLDTLRSTNSGTQ